MWKFNSISNLYIFLDLPESSINSIDLEFGSQSLKSGIPSKSLSIGQPVGKIDTFIGVF